MNAQDPRRRPENQSSLAKTQKPISEESGNPAIEAAMRRKSKEPSIRQKWLEANKPSPGAVYLGSLSKDAGARWKAELEQFIWDHLNENLLFSADPKENLWDYAVTVLSRSAGESLRHLERLARQGIPFPRNRVRYKGSGLSPREEQMSERVRSSALQSFARLTIEMVEILNQFCELMPDSLIPVAQGRVTWPVLRAKLKLLQSDHEAMLTRLQLGKDTFLGHLAPASRFNPKSKFNGVVLELLGRIQSERYAFPGFRFGTPPGWAKEALQLPPLSMLTLGEWRKLALRILNEDFDDPERAQRYLSMITAPSHQKHRKPKFMNEVVEGFDSLGGIHRRNR